MKIAGVYSFKGGEQAVTKAYPGLLPEVNAVIKSIDASAYKTKSSEEVTMQGRMLFNPRELNNAFKDGFAKFGGWRTVRVPCAYPTKYYAQGYAVGQESRSIS